MRSATRRLVLTLGTLAIPLPALLVMGCSKSSSSVPATATWTVTATAGTGGTATSSVATVQNLGSTVVTITPTTGYTVGKVTVNGTDVSTAVKAGPPITYTLNNITANTVIAVTFNAIPTYTLTATANNNNGTITPASVTVLAGASQTFTTTANAGWVLTSLMLDNTNVMSQVVQGPPQTFTLSNIQNTHALVANFTPQGPLLTSSVTGTGGTMSPSGTFNAPLAGDVTFTLTPNTGCGVLSLTVDGTIVVGGYQPTDTPVTYTLHDVTAVHTITAAFTANLLRASGVVATVNAFNNSDQSGASAIDGNLGTKWCCTDGNLTNGTAPFDKWLDLDLGSTQTVSRFVIKNDQMGGEWTGYNTRDCKVQTSATGGATDVWTDIPGASVVNNADMQINFSFAPVTTRYLRLFVTAADQAATATDCDTLRIPEVEAYTEPTVTDPNPFGLGNLNTVSGVLVTESVTTGPAEDGAKAADNDLSTKWCGSSTSAMWMQVDYPSPVTIARWKVYNAATGYESSSYNTAECHLEVSADGVTFTPVSDANASVTGNTANIIDKTLTEPLTGVQHLRLVVTKATQTATSTDAGTVRIYEFQVFAPPS